MKQEILDIEKHFTVDALRETYDDYKSSKTDRFTGKVNVPTGADGVTWRAFEKNLEVNLANISRRVLNGSYHFYPTREFNKPKPDGGMRPLSIACIRDAIVQRRLYRALQESSEEIFRTLENVSFAYRKGQSGGAAALHIWHSFKHGFLWAFDADITKFFNTLDHERLMGLVDEWVGADSLARKLIWRFIRTSYVPADSYPKQKNYFMHHKPKCSARTAGVPQGGVLSGMLANLYLHEFDRWVVKELSSQCELRYYRYADDFVILTRSKNDAESLYKPVDQKLRDIKLSLHPDKTNSSAQIAQGQLKFVGFQFFENKIRVRPKTVDKFKSDFITQIISKAIHERRNDTSLGLLEEHRQLVCYRINRKIRGPEVELCQHCNLPKEPYRNWMSYFANVITDTRQIRGLDRWIRYQVSKELHEKYKHSKFHQRLERKHWRLAKAATLESEYYRQRRFRKKYRGKRCNCSDYIDETEFIPFT